MASPLSGTNADGSKVGYPDLPVRLAVQEFFREAFGWETYLEPNETHIDLRFVENPTYGVECERANAVTPYFNNPSNHGYNNFLRDAEPVIPFETINYQARKEHYWINDKHNRWDKDSKSYVYWYTEEGGDRNLFVRSTFDFQQMIMLVPDVIRDPTKKYKTTKQPSNINRGYPEKWCGFKEENALVFTKINDIWTLDNTYESEWTPNQSDVARYFREFNSGENQTR